MTCAHVIGLIDAGPFADYPASHLNRARDHAGSCETCGRALKAATVLNRDLAALPLPAPPPHLVNSVLSRIAQIEHPQSGVADAWTARSRSIVHGHHWPGWTNVIGGIAATLSIVMATPTGNRSSVPTEGSLPLSLDLGMPLTVEGALVLTAGLLLYAAGLFAPVANRATAPELDERTSRT